MISTVRYGHIMAFTGALCLTPDGVLVRLAGMNDWSLIFWRGLMIATSLFLILAAKHRSRFFQHAIPTGQRGWWAAALFAISNVMFVLGVVHTGIASVVVILSSIPLFAALYGHLFLGEMTSRRTWIIMGVVMAGIAVVFVGNIYNGSWLGNLFALICACLTAAHISIIRSAPSATNVIPIYGWGGIFIAVVCFSSSSLIPSLQSLLVMVLMGLLSGLAFWLLGEGAKRIPAPEVTLMMMLEPTLAPVWALLIMGEKPVVSTIIGGGIVISSLMIHSFYVLANDCSLQSD
ncbi:MAG: DMT family transporter [Endozoicomonadaceae bacterium]|nr:DMT family transporter [Endozoicomonadaceae bacterium]